ncbi:hypothetical protein E2C01_063608 [Portunus trituberculatus]|uniref:Uncharacterized protein n=1 Tax=Portunus trituberculatus TaxID=210409 RepID=A0A5B7HIL7_PORTR|nr:hypothetical protein [Portunus trituberculatus]
MTWPGSGGGGGEASQESVLCPDEEHRLLMTLPQLLIYRMLHGAGVRIVSPYQAGRSHWESSSAAYDLNIQRVPPPSCTGVTRFMQKPPRSVFIAV